MGVANLNFWPFPHGVPNYDQVPNLFFGKKPMGSAILTGSYIRKWKVADGLSYLAIVDQMLCT